MQASRAVPSGVVAIVRISFVASLLVAVALAGTIAWIARGHLAADRWVNHGHLVLQELDRIRANTLQVELSTQAYRFTGDGARLAERDVAVAERTAGMARLRVLLQDNLAQAADMARLDAVLAERYAVAQRVEQLVREQGRAAANAFAAGAHLAESRERAAQILARLDQTEQRFLQQQRDRQTDLGSRIALMAGWLAAGLAVLLGVSDQLIRRQSAAIQQAQTALALSEESLAITLQSIGDGVLATDTAGRITRMNRMAEQLTGWPLADALGRPIAEVFRIIHEVTRAPAQVPVDDVLASGEPRMLANHTLLLDRAGHERPIADSAAPVLDRAGQLQGVVLVFRDVSAQQLAKQVIVQENALLERRVGERTAQLRASEQEFRQLAELMPQIVWVASANGQNVYFSRQWTAYTGLSVTESAGDGWIKPFHPDDQPAAAAAWRAAVEQGKTYVLESRLRRADGQYCWWLIRASPVLAPDGTVDKWFGTCTDIDEIKETQRSLHAREAQYRSLVENLQVGLSVHGPQGQVTSCNARVLEMFGMSREQFEAWSPSGPDWQAIRENGRPFGPAEHPLSLAMATRDAVRGVVQGIRRRGEPERVWLLVDADPTFAASGDLISVTCTYTDLTERKRAAAHVEKLAHFDQLTGLANRTLLHEHFAYAARLAERNRDALAVMFIDLDHFKDINDTLGHSVGDAVLKEIAIRLKAAVREQDTLTRQGGDEFVLILPGTNAHGAANLASKLIDVISRPCLIDQHDLQVTPSIGIAVYPSDGTTFELLSKNADSAMYRAKREGRNHFCFYTPLMQEQSARNLALANGLRYALPRGELALHYQPQFALEGRTVIGVEALVRWQHPELGVIPPAEFIPVAEASGQIMGLGEWVLRTATRQMQAWREAGLPSMVVSVNLSPLQFRQSNLPALITSILSETGLPHDCLELELTEAALDNPQAAVAMMDALNARGIRMSIDDFGTGYSSLSHLKQFKVYKLKIDKSFVRDIPGDPEDKAIVSAIISMARGLGLRTIAEGVETASQLDFLREQGCDEVQGHHFSAALAPAALEDYLRALA